MRFKKIFFALIVSLAICGIPAVTEESLEKERIIENSYRVKLLTANPFWHLLFFIYAGNGAEFSWREKKFLDNENNFSHEIVFLNKRNVEIAKFFRQNDNFSARINYSGRSKAKELTFEQAKVILGIYDFLHKAKSGDVYSGVYQSSKSYFFEIRVKEELGLLLFENDVWKEGKKTVEIKFWMEFRESVSSRMVKALVHISHCPDVLIELCPNGQCGEPEEK